MKFSSMLYSLGRRVSKSASIANDIETILTGNPSKIGKRIVNKTINKTTYKAGRMVANSVKKKVK